MRGYVRKVLGTRWGPAVLAVALVCTIAGGTRAADAVARTSSPGSNTRHSSSTAAPTTSEPTSEPVNAHERAAELGAEWARQEQIPAAYSALAACQIGFGTDAKLTSAITEADRKTWTKGCTDVLVAAGYRYDDHDAFYTDIPTMAPGDYSAMSPHAPTPQGDDPATHTYSYDPPTPRGDDPATRTHTYEPPTPQGDDPATHTETYEPPTPQGDDPSTHTETYEPPTPQGHDPSSSTDEPTEDASSGSLLG